MKGKTMYKYICLFFMLNFIYSGFKVGMDFNSEVELSFMGESIEYDLDNGFSFGFQTDRQGNGLSFGIDYLMETELEGANGAEASLISVYALYPFYIAPVANAQMVVSGMIGYSHPDLSFDGDSADLDVSGGLMYGVEAFFNNHFSAAMTFHSGEYSIASDYDYYYYSEPSIDFDVSRFTLSYIF